jgi:ADP-ribose pyrophosphatase YjhB (NUDIX family)
MLELLNKLLAGVWNKFAGTWQWYALWLMHSKFIIGVSGVITDAQGRVLLLRHRYRKHDSWGLPSGYANRSELLQDALAREVQEETGYIVEIKSLLKIVSGYKLRIEVSYRGEIVGGHLVLDRGEILEAKFFPIHELPNGILGSHRQLIALAFRNADVIDVDVIGTS